MTLAETLRNLNPTPVANVTGTLSASPPATVVPGSSTSSWGTFVSGETRTGTPSFQVTIPSSVRCGATIGLSLALTTTTTPPAGVPLTVPLKLATGVRASTDAPQSIPADPALATSTLTFPPGSGTIDRLKVRLQRLVHSWVGDLRMTLESPAGTVVTLMNSPGPGADGARGDNFVDLVLDDRATRTIEAIADQPADPAGYTGSFRPDSPLSAFDGEPRAGTWTLRVSDLFAPADRGTLHDWGIVPDGRACSAPLNGDPVAAADSYDVMSGTTLNGSSVLGNDSDPDAGALTATKRSDPAHGTLSFASDGTFTLHAGGGLHGARLVHVRRRRRQHDVEHRDGRRSRSPSSPSRRPRPRRRRRPRPAAARHRRHRHRRRPGRPRRARWPSSRCSAPASAPAGSTSGRRSRRGRAARCGCATAPRGRTTAFDAAISNGRIRVRRTAASRPALGVDRRAYAEVRRLHARRARHRDPARRAPTAHGSCAPPRASPGGRLRVAGTVTSRASGTVRVRLEYLAAGTVRALNFRARIARGRWSLNSAIPGAAAASGGQLTLLYAGDARRRIARRAARGRRRARGDPHAPISRISRSKPLLEVTEMSGKTLPQVYALVLGATLVAVGILGFLVEPSFGVGDSAERGTLILFDINGWHNVVHLLSGIVGIALAKTAANARLFCIGYGIVYVLVTVLGFIVGDGGLLLSLIPINTADNLLHALIAVVGLAIGLTSPAVAVGRPAVA